MRLEVGPIYGLVDVLLRPDGGQLFIADAHKGLPWSVGQVAQHVGAAFQDRGIDRLAVAVESNLRQGGGKQSGANRVVPGTDDALEEEE